MPGGAAGPGGEMRPRQVTEITSCASSKRGYGLRAGISGACVWKWKRRTVMEACGVGCVVLRGEDGLKGA